MEEGKVLSNAAQESGAAYAVIHEKFGEAISAFDDNATMPFFEVLDTALWTDIALFMRDHPKLKFNYMACLSGVDYPEEGKLGLVANLESLGVFGHKLAVKVKCPREGGSIPSVAGVWHTANWHEREAYDMLGMLFEGHPDMRRILCPDDWEGWPLRKDYKVQESYHGIKVPY
ncbi:NADH-quinone oxidoreductase subunit C [Chlorobium phaeovibrioides]|uniref:NADH-quinone oxidoreductase subunit C n=2 Tax=Chlorobium phaeovibrioides TaxID=1094 RepID=A0A3S0LP52_CHLPH|nr:NADH-quinone oxidoreductase subunit C [Chlorobium phaeovibrioides]HCD37081.1 NADH-quinone oxidoreductase subunit C [Chlorobium sp.]KAA6232754.1 NADH-quinone oxidoreductase subunit C [Chlorobium phaeovibrioides]MDT9546706.1 NADH-quinone oxidoreductase subunit C [Chlorobium phaeovibrioides]MWV54924.1 NADH-quinone oxidoreductase subunit C [Chlorobium phaeovibrioides]QEQ56833.1 NADH-quinone oxidoreductase subunit C [Chlorobium phaeovibrioides]